MKMDFDDWIHCLVPEGVFAASNRRLGLGNQAALTTQRWGTMMTMYSKPALDFAVANAVKAERKRCAETALAIDSGRGNEKLIADAILAEEMPPIGDSHPNATR